MILILSRFSMKSVNKNRNLPFYVKIFPHSTLRFSSHEHVIEIHINLKNFQHYVFYLFNFAALIVVNAEYGKGGVKLGQNLLKMQKCKNVKFIRGNNNNSF